MTVHELETILAQIEDKNTEVVYRGGDFGVINVKAELVGTKLMISPKMIVNILK